MRGQFNGKIIIADREVEEDIYIVEGLRRSLLGNPQTPSTHWGGKRKRKVEDFFPQLYTGLHKIQQEYTIKLREGAIGLLLSTHLAESTSH